MKKMLAILLACILTASLFSGCNWNIFDKEEGPVTGPIGKWDMPIPKINPLGSQNLYYGTEHAVGEHELTFVDNYQETSRSFSGELWRLMVKHDSPNPLYFLKKYAKKLGAQIYPSPYEDRVVFSLKNEKEPDVIWWGDAKYNGEGYELSVLKELHALPDKLLTFKPKEMGSGILNFSFATSSQGKQFQAITVTVPSGVVSATASYYMEKGVLSRKFDYSRELNSIKTSSFVLDDIPQGEGTLFWNFTWEEGNAPGEVTVLLQELYDIPQIKMGDELGALKISGIPFGSARVEVPKGGDVQHADGYSLEGDITPEGDTLFWLPAGFWNVVLEAEGINITSSKSRLVPVNAGEMTLLKLPNALKSTYSNLNAIYEEVDTTAEGIELFETKDLSETATISFAVHDPKKRDIFPDDKNTKVLEGGREVKIIDINRQGIPPSVVLLLDSSGSMKKEMAATIEAAKKFVQGLPENTFIQIVDFDSQARVLKGTTKAEVIKSLETVTAFGSTVLYDSIVMGLKILKDKQRPTLVVFSDGKDSSHDPKDVGSTATKQEVIDGIKEAIIPLYTIGFGPGHDGSTLKEFAGVSEGVYYPANDQKALENVFTAINSKFGNMFTLTYERPKELPKADTPVVSLVMDNSGSMDTDPAEEGCGYRIDKVKTLFHDFIVKLPEECLTQMINFHSSAMGGP
ncbi:MAG: Mg-chelatase subunit ChlD, partial [Clostridiales bacterium]|nr:Mg-chelatase subunit ChlD [Clostridiales bacterium]